MPVLTNAVGQVDAFRQAWKAYGNGPATAAVYIWLAGMDFSFGILLFGGFALGVACQFLNAAILALLARVSRERQMSGRLNALNSIVGVGGF